MDLRKVVIWKDSLMDVRKLYIVTDRHQAVIYHTPTDVWYYFDGTSLRGVIPSPFPAVGLDPSAVHKTGDETISGSKTFTSEIKANKGIKFDNANLGALPSGELGVAGAGYVYGFSESGEPIEDYDLATKAYVDNNGGSGTPGPAGPEGPQGERGLRGYKGAKGDPGADGGCDMSSDQCAGVKGNADLSATNHVVDMDLLFLHENNNLRHLSIDERGALSNAPRPLSAANPVVDTDTLQIYIDTFTAHSRDEHLHLTADENAALENSENPLTGTNFVVDKALLESAVLILNDNIDNVVSDFDNHKTDYTKHLGTDQNAAFDGANSPSALNVLATMNDIPASAPPAEALHESIPTIEMDIAGLLPSKIQCQGAFDDYGFDELKNAVFFIVDTHGGFRPNYIVHYYQGNQEFYVIMMPKAM